MKRNDVFEAIIKERNRQNEKFGKDKQQSLPGFIVILENEIAEAKHAWTKNITGKHQTPCEEILQVAATAVACLEKYGRMKRARTDYVVGVDMATGKDKTEIMYYDPMNKVYSPLKVLVLGYGEHGKDEFAARLAKRIGLQFVSSSQFACDRVVFPWFQEHLPGYYESAEECFEGRRNWRALWHHLICEYNLEDKARLAREIMQENDAYIGMRAADELQACVNAEVFTHIFWVDAGDRVPPEDVSSCSVKYNPDIMCMVDNSGDLNLLQEEVELTAEMLGF